MDAFLTSTAVVALAEIGDKTQLLAILLAARFGRPWLIVLGILAATLANHGLAAVVGAEVAGLLQADRARYLLAASFLVMAAWSLIPDKPGRERWTPRLGVFMTTMIWFFVIEIGDKTQIATVALAARFDSVLWVTLGTTLGMMLANVPAVFCGQALLRHVPLRWVRALAALLFLALGLWVIAETAGWV